MASSSSSSTSTFRTDVAHPYHPPTYVAKVLRNVPPHGRLRLANLPTPIHHIQNITATGTNRNDGAILPRLSELNIQLYIKRDDATGGTELGGNKLRKLEFLLADALATEGGEKCDSVVTIGGEQSNHCRATAAACRMVGLSPHIILRTSRADAIDAEKEDIGYTGNLLYDRMAGSKIYTCTPEEYTRLGSNALIDSVCNDIRNKQANSNPYPIPVGGSNGIGTWGYINAADELVQQLETCDIELDHVVFATGSGGTATGIALGLSLAYNSLDVDGRAGLRDKPPAPRVHAIGVCDNPDYFYRTMSTIAEDMGIHLPDSMTTELYLREAVTVHNGKGRGYAHSSSKELDFISQFAVETGIALDPVYTGKALYHFITTVIEEDPEAYRGAKVLFWHTGGSIGLYEKGDDLRERLLLTSQVIRIDPSILNNGAIVD